MSGVLKIYHFSVFDHCLNTESPVAKPPEDEICWRSFLDAERLFVQEAVRSEACHLPGLLESGQTGPCHKLHSVQERCSGSCKEPWIRHHLEPPLLCELDLPSD